MTLIDGRMLTELHNFYPSTVTIQESTEVPDGTGGITLAWANKAGHVDLPARIAPTKGKEVRMPDQTYSIATHTIGLRANYPLITLEDRAVADDGRTFNILALASDDQDASTYLYTEIVE